MNIILSSEKEYYIISYFGNYSVCHCQGDFSLWRGTQKIVDKLEMTDYSKVVLFQNTILILNENNFMSFPLSDTSIFGEKLDRKLFHHCFDEKKEVKIDKYAVVRVYKDSIGVEQDNNSFELFNWDNQKYTFEDLKLVNYYKWPKPKAMFKNGVLTTYC